MTVGPDFPYQPPRHVDRPPLPAGSKPRVLSYYYAWCWFMMVVYLLLVVVGIVFTVIDPSDLDMPRSEAQIMGVIYGGLGGMLFLVYLVPMFLPRGKAAWVYGFVTIGIGMTSACCLPLTIPLLLYWIKPETKSYFGV